MHVFSIHVSTVCAAILSELTGRHGIHGEGYAMQRNHLAVIAGCLLLASGLAASTEAPMPLQYRITPASATAPRISPLQYGQFIEYLCDLVPGMWADLLDDGSFEGITPNAFVFLEETDWRMRPWYPCAAVNRSVCEPDDTDQVQGRRSMRIHAPEGPPCTVGIAQAGIAVRRGLTCTFSGYFKSDRSRSVAVELTANGRILAAGTVHVETAWARQGLTLAPVTTTDRAVLQITFRGPGTLWLDCLSLMPEDAIGGWRRDVVEAVRASRPGVIRFGGSVVDYPSYGDYDWRKTIGPVEKRVPFRSWGGLQPAAAGLEEIVQFIRAVGAEPLICVRFLGSTPKEAAAQVEYFNGATSTPMGALRARNGHPEPYGIRYWQIGNEVRNEDYDRHMADFARAMKQADPTIRLLSSYPTDEVIRTGAGLVEYLCPHHYGCADLSAMEASIAGIRSAIARLAPESRMKIAVTEWNTTAGDWGPSRAMLWTLANALACSRYHNLLHRHADIVEIANRSNLANSFCAGIIQTRPGQLYLTPTYYAQQLYATKAGAIPLPVSGPTDGRLDISATADPDTGRVAMFIVNDTLEPIPGSFDIHSLGVKHGHVRITILADSQDAGEPDVANSFDVPRRISPKSRTVRTRDDGLGLDFRPLSLTVIEWKAAKSVQIAGEKGPDL